MTSPSLTIVSYVDYPSNHGLSNRVGGIAEALSKRGIHCTVLCPQSDGRQPHENIGRLRILRVATALHRMVYSGSVVTRGLAIFLFMLRAFPIACILTRARQDILIVEQVASLPLILLTRAFHRRRILLDDMTLLHLDYHFAPRTLLKILDALAVAASDVVVTTTKRTVGFVSYHFPSKRCLVVRNGVVIPDLEPNDFQEAMLETKTKMLFVGGFSFHQNLVAVRSLIQIAKTLAKREDSFEIAVVGGPISMVSDLVGRCDAGCPVRFTGPLPDPELAALYRKSYVGLLPFFGDTPLIAGQRTKALEYFARGLLAVSGPEGIGEIDGLENGEHYLSAADRQGYIELLERVLREPKSFNPLREAAYKAVSKYCSWHATTKPLYDYLSEEQSMS